MIRTMELLQDHEYVEIGEQNEIYTRNVTAPKWDAKRNSNAHATL